MKLMDFVSPDTVIPDLTGCSKEELLGKMVDCLREAGKIKDTSRLLASLMEREKIMTTGIGRGIAVPHAISAEVQEQLIVLGRAPQGVDYDSLDRAPVHFVFLLVGSPASSDRHLKTLARISRLIQHSNFVESIKKAATVDEILGILSEEDAKHKG
ncbi:PTS sugar transporter subunit IIA [bacterium]|nr:PTS sugar transporter subunit IIA [bacterium]